MAELLLLGTGAALTDGSREPTMLALRGASSTIVIDCGGNAVRQLQRLSVPLDSIERVILTHEHQDHTSGFPLLVEMLWLAGRREPLPIHGPARAIDIMRRVWGQWDTSDWEGLPELQWHAVPLEEGARIVTGADFELTAAPGRHGQTPVIGVRARDVHGGGVVVYGSDGSPSLEIQALARGADILVHEATGLYPVHSSAEQAAEVARAAGVKRLILVHLSPLENDLAEQQAAAARIFGGPVFLGEDLERFEF
ncbi:MAG: MBL fold metallo-hydrolase [Anaerolineales bacterium]|nr:MBL fold metallo-hydrolase [Anaerolineales bacterium]